MSNNNFYCVFIVTLFSPLLSFGQGKIAQITHQHYDVDSAVWITNHRENWEYDNTDREAIHATWDIYQGPFAPYNNTRLESTYHTNGQLAFQKNRSWGDTIWIETETTYEYDASDNLKKIFNENEASESDIIHYQQEVFEEDLANNKRTRQSFFTTENPDSFQIQHQRDSFFSDEDCLLKQTIINYDEQGEKINERWTTYDLNENCQVQNSGYWLYDNLGDSMYLFTRHQFSYSNNDKTQTDLYQRRNQQTNTWQTQHLVEKTVDEEGREIRYFYENYKTNYTDTTLKITTYTSEGELETFREFKTAYQSDIPLRLIRFDSLDYQYDATGNLMQKTQFAQHYTNLPRKITTRYDYYCNGQLKTEIREELPSVSRINYEYYGRTDCFLLDNEEPKLLVFPNPSDGNFTIQSNLLATSDAVVQLHSVIGQLVFTKKLNRIAPHFNVEIADLAKGHYILTVKNGREMISEKVVIR